MTLRAVVLAALAIAAALGGCGEQRAAGGGTVRTSPTPVGAPTTTIGAAVATIAVSLVDYRLQPADPRVRRQGVIAFTATNDGQTRHALSVDGPAGEVSSVALRPGERTTIEVRLPRGTYKWYCPLADHERRGMVGRVRVAE
jgi:FtsP/CotA-like multicopper oxidase with cupredoxin domain